MPPLGATSESAAKGLTARIGFAHGPSDRSETDEGSVIEASHFKPLGRPSLYGTRSKNYRRVLTVVQPNP
ncbi:protein of unknown function [Bradyrhizobium vignae]|uniref:Uncharacterized protein n=1 Tax=Bradyrhizobium vignae TaxID=1549949 RepID=A0A2U3PYB5_9BRAD|nr:protein of unknown function [Bradyrhizobium vignae]